MKCILKPISRFFVFAITMAGCAGYEDASESLRTSNSSNQTSRMLDGTARNSNGEPNGQSPESDRNSESNNQTNGTGNGYEGNERRFVASNTPTPLVTSSVVPAPPSTVAPTPIRTPPPAEDDTSSPQPPPRPTISSIDEGFAWLATSNTTSRAYLSTQDWYNPHDRGNPSLNLTAENSTLVPTAHRKRKIVRWQRLPETDPCEIDYFYADPNDPQARIQDVLGRGCSSLYKLPRPANAGHSRYGVTKCDEEKVQFLGTKDIGNFVGAFGVSIDCISENHQRIHQIWYHRDSNHPFKKVMELGATRPYVADGFSAYNAVGKTTYENIGEPGYNSDLERTPPSTTATYKVEGSIKNGGVISGRSLCSLDTNNNFVSVYIPDFYLLYIDGQQWIQGTWEPSFAVGSNTYAFGIFWNRNYMKGIISGGSAAIKFEKLGDTRYHRVTISNSVTLMNKNFMSIKQQHYAVAKDFTSFVCFAYTENRPFSERFVGEVENY